jgi:putative Mg2+ transporter-C (MgtC) family protein
MLVSKYGFSDVLRPGQVVVDPSRMAAQIVTGIGFPGAGLIFVRRDSVHGLTTAASVWVTAAVGAAAGAGLPLLAAAATVAYLIVALPFQYVCRRLPRPGTAISLLRVRYPDGRGTLRRVLEVATACGFVVDDLATGSTATDDVHQPGAVSGQRTVEVVLHVHGTGSVNDLAARLSEQRRRNRIGLKDQERRYQSRHLLVVASRLRGVAGGAAGQGEQQVREPVEVAQHLVADGMAAGPGADRVPLGPADHGAAEVEHRAGLCRPGHHEHRAQRPFGDQVVDDLLEAGGQLRGDQGDPWDQAVALPRAGRQVGGGREQLPLQPQYHLGQTRLQAGSAGRAERGDRLVDVAVGVDQFVALGHPAAVQQAGGAVVSGLGVDPARGHDRLPVTAAGCAAPQGCGKVKNSSVSTRPGLAPHARAAAAHAVTNPGAPAM